MRRKMSSWDQERAVGITQGIHMLSHATSADSTVRVECKMRLLCCGFLHSLMFLLLWLLLDRTAMR